MAGSGQRHGANALGRHAEVVDHFAADRFAHRQNHAGAAQPDQPGSAPADAVGIGVVAVELPRCFTPRGQIVNGQNGRRRAEIRHFEIGAVKNLRAGLRGWRCWIPQSHQRRSAALCGVGPRSRLAGARSGIGKGWSESKRVGVFGKLPRQRDATVR